MVCLGLVDLYGLDCQIFKVDLQIFNIERFVKYGDVLVDYVGDNFWVGVVGDDDGWQIVIYGFFQGYDCIVVCFVMGQLEVGNDNIWW